MRGKLWSGYEALMQTLRQKLDAAAAADGHYYMLTAAVPGSGWLLRGEEVYQVVQYLDFANIMSYDLHGAWNLYVAGLAPLYDDGKDPELAAGGVYGAYQGMGYLNTDWAYHYFRGAMPGGRINIGVPFYTRGWTGVTGGTNGMYGTAPLPDQNQCPPGTGGKIGSSTACGNGATGIDNLWHDLDGQGKEVPSGVNPIWHVLNLQNGVRGAYAASYGVPDASQIVGTYSHQFDATTKAEWWWDATTRTLLTGDADQAIAAKADYVAAGQAGGVMIWELAGDYAYDTAKSEYGMGETLIDTIYSKLSAAQPYGATKADPGTTMPSQAIPLDITFTDFALGDNNYPINPKVTFFNDSSVAIPAGSTITFDYATSNLPTMSEQNGWGLTLVKAGHTGANVGGIKGNFDTVQLKVPSGGIPAGGSAWTKLSWSLPMAQVSNVRVAIGGTTYGATYAAARGVTVVNPGDGGGDSGDGNGQDPGQCTGNPWAAGTIYNGGAKVYYNAHYWTARWWTQGDQPGSGGDWGPWADNGGC
jgi:chitinase